MKTGDYLIVPISLLKDAFVNIRQTMDRIFNYAVYSHAINHLSMGTELERMKAAASFFNITLGDDERSLNNGALAYSNPKYNNNYPLFSIHKKHVFEFYNNHESKTEFEIATLCAFCACRSILGQHNKQVKTNNKMIVARMFGERKPMKENTSYPSSFDSLTRASHYLNDRYRDMLSYNNSSANYLSQAINNGKLKAVVTGDAQHKRYQVKRKDLGVWLFENNKESLADQLSVSYLKHKYSQRYHIDKLMTELELNWHLKKYGTYMRGYYISFDMELDELVKFVESKKERNRKELLKQEKVEARNKALRDLGII